MSVITDLAAVLDAQYEDDPGIPLWVALTYRGVPVTGRARGTFRRDPDGWFRNTTRIEWPELPRRRFGRGHRIDGLAVYLTATGGTILTNPGITWNRHTVPGRATPSIESGCLSLHERYLP